MEYEITYDVLKDEHKEEVANVYSITFSRAPWYSNYTPKDTLGFLEDAMRRKGFICLVAKLADKVVGFSWGFLVPDEDVRNITFTKIRKMLSDKGIDADTCFYGAVTAVLPDFQRRGIGTELITRRTELAREHGVTGLLNRTKNDNMVKSYKKVFGEENVITLFNDPILSDRMWYYTKLNNTKS